MGCEQFVSTGQEKSCDVISLEAGKGVTSYSRDVILLEAVLLLELPVLLDESVDAVDHLLDQLHLAVAEAVLVRDVVRHAGLTTRLPAGSCTR